MNKFERIKNNLLCVQWNILIDIQLQHEVHLNIFPSIYKKICLIKQKLKISINKWAEKKETNENHLKYDSISNFLTNADCFRINVHRFSIISIHSSTRQLVTQSEPSELINIWKFININKKYFIRYIIFYKIFANELTKLYKLYKSKIIHEHINFYTYFVRQQKEVLFRQIFHLLQ